MKKYDRKEQKTVVGLDVHKDTIMAAVLPPGADNPLPEVQIPNHPAAIRKWVTRWASRGPLVFVYEAGPCGFELQRQIAALGHPCVVVAPGLTPVRPGDRVKTDRRDARKLARLYRAGELTPIRIPTREEEAARDLVRTREDALEDRLRAYHRLSKFLLRQGRIYRETRSWGVKHRAWLHAQRFEGRPLQQTFEACLRALEEAELRLQVLDRQVLDLAESEPYRVPVQYLRCLKGVDTRTAVTLVVEAQEFRRFDARTFMGYCGLGLTEDSSAGKIRRGHITKVGNAHLRRVLVEAAWSYRHRNRVGPALAQRRQGCPMEVVGIAKKAQDRLHRKFWGLMNHRKLPQVVVVAVARELAGFVWAIAQRFPKEEAA